MAGPEDAVAWASLIPPCSNGGLFDVAGPIRGADGLADFYVAGFVRGATGLISDDEEKGQHPRRVGCEPSLPGWRGCVGGHGRGFLLVQEGLGCRLGRLEGVGDGDGCG